MTTHAFEDVAGRVIEAVAARDRAGLAELDAALAADPGAAFVCARRLARQGILESTRPGVYALSEATVDSLVADGAVVVDLDPSGVTHLEPDVDAEVLRDDGEEEAAGDERSTGDSDVDSGVDGPDGTGTERGNDDRPGTGGREAGGDRAGSGDRIGASDRPGDDHGGEADDRGDSDAGDG